MDRTGQPVEGQNPGQIACKDIKRRNYVAIRVLSSHQTLESDGAAVGDTENRLEVAAKGQTSEVSDSLIAAGVKQVKDRLQLGRVRLIRSVHRALTSDPLILTAKPRIREFFCALQAGKGIIRKFNELAGPVWYTSRPFSPHRFQ